MRFLFRAALCISACATVPVIGVAQEGPQTVRIIVRADAKRSGAPVSADSIRLNFNGHDVPVTSVRSLIAPGSKPVEIAILIDDSLRGNFGNQVGEIRKFVQGMASSGAAVAVGYMQNGRVLFGEGGFSSDPDTVARNLRLPMSGAGISGSPYFCLQDAIKHWPGNSGAARVVLMLTNGIDLYNGPAIPQNQNSPYVQQAIVDAQKAGVPVYSIYYGRFDVHPGYGSFSGQGYLGQVADDTGAETFNQGTLNPPTIASYLGDFERDLRSSYVVTFTTASGRLEALKVKSTNGAKLHVQREATVAASMSR